MHRKPRPGPLEVDIDRLVAEHVSAACAGRRPSLEELANSIKSNGVIQPIVVRKSGDRFQIIAGERRWRAAQKAGLMRVPVVVREVEPGDEGSLLEMALIENIQRENLNPIDEARAYRRLSEEFHLTQEVIAARVGKDRASVANYVRLLKLPDRSAGRGGGGHAFDGPRARAGGLVERGRSAPPGSRRDRPQSVGAGNRVARQEDRRRRPPQADPPPVPDAKPVDVHTRAAEERLRLAFGTRVRIVRQGTKGRIEIDFGSEEELIRIYDQLAARR